MLNVSLHYCSESLNNLICSFLMYVFIYFVSIAKLFSFFSPVIFWVISTSSTRTSLYLGLFRVWSRAKLNSLRLLAWPLNASHKISVYVPAIRYNLPSWKHFSVLMNTDGYSRGIDLFPRRERSAININLIGVSLPESIERDVYCVARVAGRVP